MRPPIRNTAYTPSTLNQPAISNSNGLPQQDDSSTFDNKRLSSLSSLSTNSELLFAMAAPKLSDDSESFVKDENRDAKLVKDYEAYKNTREYRQHAGALAQKSQTEDYIEPTQTSLLSMTKQALCCLFSVPGMSKFKRENEQNSENTQSQENSEKNTSSLAQNHSETKVSTTDNTKTNKIDSDGRYIKLHGLEEAAGVQLRSTYYDKTDISEDSNITDLL